MKQLSSYTNLIAHSDFRENTVDMQMELRGKGIIDTHRGQWAVLDIRELQGLLDE
ncbi:hypothetical protein [Listeria booriae]|uniref:hypothetical protein n=1 Tax=Listeria booriae TaxID=1552123 RepID=UPI0016285771|nr:hypothetical protein [Listeria booriae]MBC2256815.1 hypothetical protein [Listeria booriae]